MAAASSYQEGKLEDKMISRLVGVLTAVETMGMMIPWAPASSALLMSQGSPEGSLTKGDTPNGAIE